LVFRSKDNLTSTLLHYNGSDSDIQGNSEVVGRKEEW